MKVNFISDLHTDFHIRAKNPQDPKFNLRIAEFIDRMLPVDRTACGDVLIIAGDLGHYNQQAKEMLIQLKETYKDIIVVSGNHDRYLVSDHVCKQYEWQSQQRVDELQSMCNAIDGVHFLDGDVVDINGVRFGGLCGWYDLPNSGDIKHWRQALNDSNLIYDGYPIAGAYSYGARGKPDWDTQQHYIDELQKLAGVAREGCDVLVSHVAQILPPEQEMPVMYRGDPGNIFYWVDNYDLVKKTGCSHYIFGHTHDPYDYMTDDFNALCNPYGYPGENEGCRVKSFEI